MDKRMVYFILILAFVLTIIIILIGLFNSVQLAPTPEGLIQNEWTKLPKGKIIFNPPKEMIQGVKETIEVRITKNISNITTELTAGLKGRGEPQIDEIQIAPQMEVQLLGDEKSFEIMPLFTISKQTMVDDYIQWKWDVTPLKPGNQTLNLCVYAIMEIPGQSEKYVKLPLMEREIYVTVSYRYYVSTFLAQEWKWIFSGITGFIGYYIGRRKSDGNPLFTSDKIEKRYWWQFWK